MPNRVLRDELLTSERWWSVSADGRTLWISVFLSADDLGRCPGSNFVCRTKYMAGTVNHERIEKLVTELMDVDLLRIYEVDGMRFFFIPRFRQFVRYTRSRYPEPPIEINDIVINKQCLSTAHATLKRPEVKRSEEKRSTTKPRFALPEWVSQEVWRSFEESRSKLRKPLTDRAKQLAVAELQRLRDAGNDPIAVIEASVLNGWLTFYPPKSGAAGSVKKVAA